MIEKNIYTPLLSFYIKRARKLIGLTIRLTIGLAAILVGGNIVLVL